MPAVAVVGHVEWCRFAVVDRVPARGEIVEAHDGFALAAGGGAVAAVQLRRLAGAASLFTAWGDDAAARDCAAQLHGHGVDVHASTRPGPQREAFVHLSADQERTITVVGDRLVPHGADALSWERLDAADAVYFTGGDAGALRHARRARVLVATARALDVLRAGAVPVDVLVASGNDMGERYENDLDPPPGCVVLTHGADGGRWEGGERRRGRWRAAELSGPPVDAYGCGDAFAAGLTFALGAGASIDAALDLAARCGAAVLCGRGPYEGQLAGPARR